MSMLSSEKTIIYTQSQFLNRFDMNKETATIRLLSYLRSCGKNLSQERLMFSILFSNSRPGAILRLRSW